MKVKRRVPWYERISHNGPNPNLLERKLTPRQARAMLLRMFRRFVDTNNPDDHRAAACVAVVRTEIRLCK